MAVKIRRAKHHAQCSSCLKKEGEAKQLCEVGIGPRYRLQISCLCDECMHSLLQKLIIAGSDF